MRKHVSYDVPIAIWEPTMKVARGGDYMNLSFEVTSKEEYLSHINKRDDPALGVKNFVDEDLPEGITDAQRLSAIEAAIMDLAGEIYG